MTSTIWKEHPKTRNFYHLLMARVEFLKKEAELFHNWLVLKTLTIIEIIITVIIIECSHGKNPKTSWKSLQNLQQLPEILPDYFYVTCLWSRMQWWISFTHCTSGQCTPHLFGVKQQFNNLSVTIPKNTLSQREPVYKNYITIKVRNSFKFVSPQNSLPSALWSPHDEKIKIVPYALRTDLN